ncbi:MAG TPA: geranylgeranyl reductase family protein [Gaiellales bacterium]|nr:geranylgeranyl reductase family protein [Gaiellales bacterium]
MERFDVIVVGAGPAGSVTAHLLAGEGVRTLLVERARFPRDKPCGGGVTLRGARLLPFAIGPVVERQITTIGFRHADLGSFAHGGLAPVVLMTQRKRLDAFMAEQAALAGADLRDGLRVRTVELEEDGRPAVTFDDGSRAGGEVLIAADGANGICGRSLQLGEGRIFAPALEANVAYDAVGAGVEQHVALLEMGYVPGGYGWLFPKGDHANVGVGGWGSEGPHLRDHLRRVCERHDIAWSSLTEIRGHRLPMRGPSTRVANGRALAVGDAAGLVDPLSGDGMYEAFSSAHVASACTRDLLEGRTTDLSAYPERLDAALGRHTSLAWIAKAAIERAPGLALRVARSNAIRRRFLLRTATSRDPLGRSAPHAVWRQAERAARRLLGPEAG